MRRENTTLSTRRAGLMQIPLLVAVLLGCLLMPRHGGAVLLVPVFATNAVVAAFPVAVLHAGWLPGSLLVRIRGDVPVAALLRQGILPLAAPEFLCRTERVQRHG